MSHDKRFRPEGTLEIGTHKLLKACLFFSLFWTCDQVPLARSETHLSELLDGVCSSMNDYALHVDPDTQLKQYLRFAPKSSSATGDFPNFKNFQFNGPEESNALKFAVSAKVHN